MADTTRAINSIVVCISICTTSLSMRSKMRNRLPSMAVLRIFSIPYRRPAWASFFVPAQRICREKQTFP